MNRANIRHAFVSGGAGFIGSHIAVRLVKAGVHVTIYDNFSTGQESFISHHADNPNVRVVRADILDSERLNREIAGCDFVFHLQANADVRGRVRATRVDLRTGSCCGRYGAIHAESACTARRHQVPLCGFEERSCTA